MNQKILKILSLLKNLYELDKPKCPHRKLYRLPRDVYVCPECFRCFNATSMWFNRIALDDKEIDRLISLTHKQRKVKNE